MPQKCHRNVIHVKAHEQVRTHMYSSGVLQFFVPSGLNVEGMREILKESELKFLIYPRGKSEETDDRPFLSSVPHHKMF